jgi:hypothetical protein
VGCNLGEELRREELRRSRNLERISQRRQGPLEYLRRTMRRYRRLPTFVARGSNLGEDSVVEATWERILRILWWKQPGRGFCGTWKQPGRGFCDAQSAKAAKASLLMPSQVPFRCRT